MFPGGVCYSVVRIMYVGYNIHWETGFTLTPHIAAMRASECPPDMAAIGALRESATVRASCGTECQAQ